MAVSFIGRGNQSSHRKPLVCAIHFHINRIGGVMIRVLALKMVDHRV